MRQSNDHKNIGREHEQEWECDKVKGVEENELCREDANREEKMLQFQRCRSVSHSITILHM